MLEAPMGDLGPSYIWYKGVNTGENKQVRIRVSDDTAPVKTARGGTAPVNEIYTGRTAEVEGQMMQQTIIQLGIIIPGSESVGNAVIVSNPVGQSLRTLGGELVIVPIVSNAGSLDKKRWVTFPMAGVKLDMEIPYDGEGEERMFKVLWTCYKLEAADLLVVGYSGWSEGELFMIGESSTTRDSTITWS